MDRRYARVIVDFLETTKELNEVTGLSRDAIGLAQALPPLSQAVNRATGQEVITLEQAQAIAAQATRGRIRFPAPFSAGNYFAVECL
jgi:hypothetical protein